MTDDMDQVVSALNDAIDQHDYTAVASCSAELVRLMESSVAGNARAFYRTLAEHADQFDYERVSALCEQLVEHLQTLDTPYPQDIANKIIRKLQRKQLYPDLLTVADQFIQSGCASHSVKRRYAQALIEQGHYSAAESLLLALEKQCVANSNEKEKIEAQGLRGRIYKQLYINAASHGKPPAKSARKLLRKSFKIYHDVYADNHDNIWHGINAVALWHRAQRDGIELPLDDISTSTKAILDSITSLDDEGDASEANKRSDMWATATAAEASLAMGNYQSVVAWLERYVDDKHVNDNNSDAFEVASTLRQFEEVWQLDNSETEHSRILQVLRAALLKRNGGSISLARPQNDIETIDGILGDKSYEAILGRERFKNLRWLKTGFERAQGVCKITDQMGEAFGTGFLLESDKLRLPGQQKWVVLTNAHVVSHDPAELRGEPRAKSPDTVKIIFEASSNPEVEYTVDRILAWSPRHKLDFSVLALKESVEFSRPFPVAKALPLIDANQRIYLIGHPRGGQLSFSLYDNLLIDHENPKVHYRSPTLGGSSGSPVFNQAWDLIGLHHAGGKGIQKLNGQAGTYSANEGLWIQSIISAIDAKQNVAGAQV